MPNHNSILPSPWPEVPLRAGLSLRLKGWRNARQLAPVAIGLQHEDGSVKRVYWDNRTRLTPDREPYCLFQYTLRGQAVFADADGERVLRPGDGFLAPIPSETSYWLPENQTWAWVWIAFEGETGMEVTSRLIKRAGHVLTMEENAPAILILKQIYAAACRQMLGSAYDVSAEVYRFLMALWQDAVPSEQAHPAPVAAALSLIERRYADPALSLDDLATSANLSRHHFARLFRKHVGDSPGACLTETRLRRAMDLVTFTRMPVQQIAVAVGYRHTSHFIAQFRRRYGVTPGVARG